MKIHNIRKTGLVLALLWLAMVIVQGTFFTAQARPEREISKIARQLLTQLDREYQGKEVLQVRATLFPGENSCAVSPFSAMLHKALQREINRGTLAFQGGELVELRGTYSLDRQLSIKGVLVDLQNGRLIAETLINIAPANLSTKWFAIDPEGFLASVPDCILDRLAKDFPNNPETAVSVAGFRDSASGLPSVFSRLFKKRMEEAVVNSQRFKPSDGVFFLGGTYSLDARFHLTVRITDHRHHAFSLVNLTLPGASVNRNWFQVYLDDHIQVMVDKLANNIPGHENVVLATNDITYRDSGAGSGLGRYLSNHLHMLLSKHPRFTVVEYRKTKRIVGSKNYRGLKKRRVGRDEITMQIGATNYLAGQYWDLGPDTIQLSLKIHTPGHRLAAAAIQDIGRELLPADLPAQPSKEPITVENRPDKQHERPSGMSNIDIPLEISLQTSRGDGGTYYENEKFSIFFSSSRAGYARVYYLQSNGTLLEIFPDINGGDGYVEAEKMYSIPDASLKYEYQVSPPFGFEEVFAFISDRPLPSLGRKGESDFREYRGSYQDLVAALFPKGEFKGEKAEKSIMITTIPK